MYSRNLSDGGGLRERSFVIPENYRGNAFIEREADETKPEKMPTCQNDAGGRETVGRVYPQKARSTPLVSPVMSIPTDMPVKSLPAESYSREEKEESLVNEAESKAAEKGERGLRGGFDELIIIGLILLLAQSEGNDDLILALALLLLLS